MSQLLKAWVDALRFSNSRACMRLSQIEKMTASYFSEAELPLGKAAVDVVLHSELGDGALGELIKQVEALRGHLLLLPEAPDETMRRRSATVSFEGARDLCL